MKISKLLLLGMLVSSFCMVGSAFAAALADDLLADGTEYRIGDVVCYTISLSALNGDLTAVSSYLYVPAQVGDETCEGVNAAPGGTLIVGPTTLVDIFDGGSPLELDCGDTLVLAYEIQPGDYTDADGPSLTAKLGTEATDAGEPDCDQETRTVTILPPDPNTDVGITATPDFAPFPYTTDLVVTEENTGLDPLYNVHVDVFSRIPPTTGPAVLLFTLTTPDSGDGGVAGVLEVGEIWTYNTAPLLDILISEPTEFIAVGYGEDVLGNVVTYGGPDVYPDEREKVIVDGPPPPCVEVTKEVNCDISKAGDQVTYHYCIHNCGTIPVVVLDWIDTVVAHGVIGAAIEAQCPDILNPEIGLGPDDECCFDVDFVIPAEDPFGDPIVNGFAVLVEDLIYGQLTDSGELVMAEVDIVHPSFIATKDCRTDDLEVGDTAIFDIRIENDGDVCLRFDLTELGAPVQFDLAAGEVEEWETHILVETEEDIFNSIIGTAILIPGDPPEECGEPTDCLDNILLVDANDTCDVGGGATRTPGYWKTHTYMAECMFDMCYPDGIDFGWTDVNDVNDLMAIFHAKKAKLNKLCQARLQLSFHVGAAILNDCLPNGLPFESHTGETFAGLAAIMADCDVAAIKAKIGIVGGYNEFGDEVEIIWPGGVCDDLIAYNATPKVSKEWAATVDLAALMVECEDCGVMPMAAGNGKKK